jgi:HPt (histidine-containing phosphotransfer) domain-containing protein
MMNTSTVDQEILASILGVGGSDLLAEMLSLFLSQIEHYGQAVETGLAKHDYPSLETDLHAMKSAASSLGFVALESCLKGFEKAVQTQTAWPELCCMAEDWRSSVAQAKDCAEQLLSQQ